MSWAKALQSSNVSIFNPSITQDGRLYYYSNGNQYELSNGRPCNSINKPHDIYISQSFNQRDYIDRDNNYELQSALRYYNANNVFPTVDEVNQTKNIRVEPFELSKPINQSNNYSDDLVEAFIKIPMSDVEYPVVDELYKELLRSYTYSILNFVLNFESYRPWIKHWKWLEKNIYKNDLKIYKLSEEHQQVAYNYNKCQHMNFRWKDNKGYISKNVFAYVLLHELAHASFPPEFKQHKHPFNDILCLLTVAAVELDLINLSKLPITEYVSNNTPILSKSSFLNEVRHGIRLLIEVNDDNKDIVDYYNDRLKLLNNYY